MGFTTPAFIRKNTPELRKKLERLGYYLHPECIDDDRGNYLFVNREYYLNRPLGYSEELSRSIDCGTNEDLFLAIAALRDDTSANQYWVFDQDFLPHYKKGDFTIGHFIRCSCYCHVASVKELIEHFKGKEVNHG